MYVTPFPNGVSVHKTADIAMPVPNRQTTRNQYGDDEQDD
jgi:hypothetical protein